MAAFSLIQSRKAVRLMADKGRENLVEVRHLKQYFNINVGMFSSKPLKAVDDVSFSIRKGETLGLVGESGCGKTTVGRTLLHLYKPTGGEILFEGKPVATASMPPWSFRIPIPRSIRA